MNHIPEGYLVEGDSILDDHALEQGHGKQANLLRVGSEEPYRTTALVGNLPRAITISVSSSLPSVYVTAVDELIRRYNAEGLRVTFSRVSSGGAIRLTADFPRGGNPYSQVLVNVGALGSSTGTSRVN